MSVEEGVLIDRLLADEPRASDDVKCTYWKQKLSELPPKSSNAVGYVRKKGRSVCSSAESGRGRAATGLEARSRSPRTNFRGGGHGFSPGQAQETPDYQVTDSEIDAFIKAHNSLSDGRTHLLRERTIEIGMTEDEVKLIYGPPDDINRNGGSWGLAEQWVYENGPEKDEFLYFENGRLTSWQD